MDSKKRKTTDDFRGNADYLAERRKRLSVLILPIYAQGHGIKAISAATGVSRRLVRTILIEAGVYNPAAIRAGEVYRNKISSARKRAADMRARARGELPLSTLELIKAARAKKRKRTTLAWADLPLFKQARIRENTARYRKRYTEDMAFRLQEMLRRRIRKVTLRGRGYSGSTLPWLGCTPEQFRAHIEGQWKPGMHWGNIGYGLGQWQIDHITPVSFYDMTNEKERLECFHWSNHQPMWAADNMRKSDRIGSIMRASEREVAQWVTTTCAHTLGDKVSIETETSRRTATVIATKPGFTLIRYQEQLVKC